MPIKYINKSNVGASAGNSVLFNGSNFLNFGSNALFSFGTGNFTVEGWIYLTTMGVFNALFSNGEPVAGAIALYTLTNNKLSFAEYYGTDVNGTTTLSINTWYHVAVTRSGSTVRLFLNGNIENSNPSDSFNNTTNNLIIGSVWGTRADGRMNGYISNFRVVKGTALYTSNFTPPTAPLTAIANTSILTCQSPTIIDNSTNNFTITNNGAATVSSVVPFSASIAQAPSGIKFRNRSNSGIPVPTGNSVLFNGSNQYLSVANNAAFSFGTGDYTVEGWMYFNVLDNYRPLFSNGAAIAGAVGLYSNPSKKLQYDEYYGGSFIGTTVLSINTWYHVAVTRSGSTIRLFLNGNIENSNTTTFNNNTDGLIIGGAWIQSSPHNTLNGYISNFRIVKGTAVYTASFTPSTSPLTAISGTSLLTCQSPTIIDNSSNNFTITNNNSVTVSSVTPFTVSTATSTMKIKKVNADPNPYMVATGGDLVTTSGSYKIHTFTTVGTSSFVVSTAGTVPTIGVLTVAGGGGGAGYRYGVGWGGGGGGGGVTEVSELTVGANTYSVIVGAGGVRGSYAADGGNGEQSSFGATLVTASGGFGGKSPPNGNNGGTSGNGFLGGTASGGGGGGGAAQTGFTSGPGGMGATSSLSGTITYYGGGGGGGTGGSLGPGGLGGGGSNNGTAGGGTDGTPNTGGGGANTGGDPSGNQFGRAGGSGIVIIKYRYTT